MSTFIEIQARYLRIRTKDMSSEARQAWILKWICENAKSARIKYELKHKR